MAGEATGEALPFLRGYPPTLLQQVQRMLDEDRVGTWLAERHPAGHAVRSDAALYDYVQACKRTHLRSAPPVSKVAYVARLEVVQQALGTHARVSRPQGNRLKAKREIRIARLFQEAPADFLRMIVVHELAHLREAEHDRAFYALCCHMEPAYHQLEFDTRVWLSWRASRKALPGRPADDLSTGAT